MKNFKRRSIVLMVTMAMLLSSVISVSAAVGDTLLDDVIKDTASYMYKTVAKPQVGSVGAL